MSEELKEALEEFISNAEVQNANVADLIALLRPYIVTAEKVVQGIPAEDVRYILLMTVAGSLASGATPESFSLDGIVGLREAMDEELSKCH